jgi:hypothetical protein
MFSPNTYISSCMGLEFMCFAREPFVEGCVTRVLRCHVAVCGDATYVVHWPCEAVSHSLWGLKYVPSRHYRSSWLVQECSHYPYFLRIIGIKEWWVGVECLDSWTLSDVWARRSILIISHAWGLFCSICCLCHTQRPLLKVEASI